MQILIYGSYGYTGELIVQQCKDQGLLPHLAGRNQAALKAQSIKYDLPYTVCEVSVKAFKELVADHDVLVHCAGPFIHTAEIAIEACVEGKTHYLDITGEYEVFELAQKFDRQAKEQQVMVLPGCGFDVVPSDCLAAYLKDRLEDASSLRIAFAGLGAGMSRGTAKTMVEGIGKGGRIRKNGRLIKVSSTHHITTIDFGPFSSKAVTIPWGDISTAYFSTGIPTIMVYMAVNKKIIRSLQLGDLFGFVFRWSWVKRMMKKKVEKRSPGPSDQKRQKVSSYFWAEARNDRDDRVISKLKVPDGYTLTALCTVAILQKIQKGLIKEGYQTPSTAFGADFILEIPGCTRTDE